jgi:hypothetical protein
MCCQQHVCFPLYLYIWLQTAYVTATDGTVSELSYAEVTEYVLAPAQFVMTMSKSCCMGI